MNAIIQLIRLSPRDDFSIVPAGDPNGFAPLIAAVRDLRNGPVQSRQPTR